MCKFANEYTSKLEEAYESNMFKARKIMKEARKNSKKLTANFPINNAFFLMRSYYTPYAIPVYERLKDIHPKEYVTNKRKLYELLKKYLINPFRI